MLEEAAQLGTVSAGAHVCGLSSGSGALRLTAACEHVEGGNQVVCFTKTSMRRFCRDFCCAGEMMYEQKLTRYKYFKWN